jgi:Spy/CpxP family protein refolding chaperone
MFMVSGTSAIASPPHASPTHLPAYSALDDAHLKHLFHELMGRVDAGQKDQMRRVGHAALADLELLEGRARNERAPRAGILLAETIDHAALERVRIGEMAVAEERSRRVDLLLIDLATVMTPQQRARFNDELQGAAH